VNGYARNGDAHVAYQVIGDGPIDIVGLTTGFTVWIDRDEEPHWARFDRRLASFSRLIRYAPRGFGLSDPPAGPASIEEWADDARCVLDALESERAVLFGVGYGGLAAMQFAADFPDRTAALVLMHTWARLARADDFPIGIPQRVIDTFVNTITDTDSSEGVVDDLSMMNPSLAEDTAFRAWWKHAGERGLSPANARAVNLLGTRVDLRDRLPSIAAPTLVLHRVDDQFLRVEHGRFLADHIPNATFVELPGNDHVAFAGETDELLGSIEEFVTGSRGVGNAERVLATILFSDIVDSTKRAAATGDRRWRDLLDNHDRMARRAVERFGGTRVKTTGDGMLATFPSPAAAIACGQALCDGARDLGIEVRVGLHTAEIERRGDDIAGIGVHIASRVESHAAPGEVWVSRTVVDVVIGSDIAFGSHGEHDLKGVPGRWELFAVQRGT
jgi:class 3 adenylate cyclase